MSAWTDEHERHVALSLGECLQRQWAWKTPYFIPSDRTVAVLGGPDSWTYFEMDLADAFKEFEEQLGRRMKAGFWEKAVDWNDRNGCFGDLVRKVSAELGHTTGCKAKLGSGTA